MDSIEDTTVQTATNLDDPDMAFITEYMALAMKKSSHQVKIK